MEIAAVRIIEAAAQTLTSEEMGKEGI